MSRRWVYFDRNGFVSGSSRMYEDTEESGFTIDAVTIIGVIILIVIADKAGVVNFPSIKEMLSWGLSGIKELARILF